MSSQKMCQPFQLVINRSRIYSLPSLSAFCHTLRDEIETDKYLQNITDRISKNKNATNQKKNKKKSKKQKEAGTLIFLTQK